MTIFYKSKMIFIILVIIFISCSVLAEDEINFTKASPEGNLNDLSLSKLSKSETYMIVTADKRASIAAKNILDKGGSAIDAVIAAQMVLNVVEPQSSGIGGGGFLIYFDANKKESLAFDGRERAPIKYHSKVFLRKDGNKKGFIEAISGGLAVGAPSLLSMLEVAHKKYGLLDWKNLFNEAINYAENGFIVGERLSKLSKKAPHLKNQTETNQYFHIDNGGLQSGQELMNYDLASTFKIIRDKGSSGLLNGEIADSILLKTKQSKNPGLLMFEDFSIVKPKIVLPLCENYRGWKICGMRPPSSGGITILQILGILNNFDITFDENREVKIWHLFLEASKLAYADRDYYIADEDFQTVPISEMLDGNYLASRANLINDSMINNIVNPGKFKRKAVNNIGKDITSEFASTTHISIIDQFGNAASLTSSIEFMFGSGLMASGFLLNNQMTDFSFYPLDKKGNPIANRPESRKKPRSSMSPTLVFDAAENLRLVIGSPGGSRIICYVAASLVRFIDFNMPIQDIVHSPNICNRGSYSAIEIGEKGDEIASKMERFGYKIERKTMTSGIHIAYRDEKGILWGTADPRREGTAVGK